MFHSELPIEVELANRTQEDFALVVGVSSSDLDKESLKSRVTTEVFPALVDGRDDCEEDDCLPLQVNKEFPLDNLDSF